MINSNEVFTRVRDALKTEFGTKTYVVGEFVDTPAQFPCVAIINRGEVPLTRYMTIDGTDEQHRSTFEIQAFSNLTSGGTTQAKQLVECALEEFKSMGFRATVNMPLDNADKSIKRHVARVTRVIGGGDTI